MGLINLEPTLRDGEEVRWRRPAAMCLPDRTVGGTLFATNLSLIFMPNRLNRRTDLVSQRVSIQDVSGVAVADRTPSLASRRNGGLQRRLRLETRYGDALLFVIRRPDAAAAELGRLVGRRSGDG